MKSKIKLISKLMFLVLISLLVFSMSFFGNGVFAVSKLGSQGEEVKKIQSYLSETGYFTGKIDGIFGEKTKSALISFQKDKGLKADGVAGSNTLKAMGIGTGSSSGGYMNYSAADMELLARVTSAESRGEPYQGQVAVAAVILNRIEHPSFPGSLSGVIYQPGAFSCINDGGINAPVADSSRKAAREAVAGSDPSGGAIYYYNPEKSTSKWIFSRPVIAVIGEHRFCS